MQSLTGVLVDVSNSMHDNVGDRVEQEGGKWAKSIFKFIDRLITQDSTSDQVFVVGFGASCLHITFDVLTTMKLLLHLQRDERTAVQLLKDGLDFVERHGAPRVRTWTTVNEIRKHIRDRASAAALLYALENKPEFRRKFIYDCLPADCREVQSYGREAGRIVANINSAFPVIPIVSTAVSFSRDYTVGKSVNAVVTEGLDMAKNYIVESVTDKAVTRASDALKIIRGTVGEQEITDRRLNELLEVVEPYIYGGTPLMRSLREAVDLFKSRRHQKLTYKLLFVVSDGEPTDDKNPPLRELRDLGVTVVCCYITRKAIADPRRLYSLPCPEWEEAVKFMFSMSSVIPTQKIPRTMFVKKGWNIDIDSNETRMFFQINHPDIIHEVCDLAKECVCSQDVLSEVLSSVSLDIYIDKSYEKLEAHQQEAATCYAVAAATVMDMAMKRIVGRDGGYPDFYELRDELIGMYGTGPAVVGKVLREVCPKYRLKYESRDERGAMTAIVEKRPIIAMYQLTQREKALFSDFYRRNRRGILTTKELNISQRPAGAKLGGHAVVLTSFDAESFRLMNSRGRSFANGGFFKVKNAAVLGLRFYDVYWTEQDLLPSELEAYTVHGRETSAKLMKSLKSLQTATYTCPLCEMESKVSDYRGHLLETECPRCEGTFNANEAGSDLALNIYLTSLLPEPREAAAAEMP